MSAFELHKLGNINEAKNSADKENESPGKRHQKRCRECHDKTSYYCIECSYPCNDSYHGICKPYDKSMKTLIHCWFIHCKKF